MRYTFDLLMKQGTERFAKSRLLSEDYSKLEECFTTLLFISASKMPQPPGYWFIAKLILQ